MDPNALGDLLREAVTVVIKVAGPMLLLSMVVGVLVAIFQAVTQIHEQTIAFILKVTVIILVLLIGGGWMMSLLQDYARTLLAFISS